MDHARNVLLYQTLKQRVKHEAQLIARLKQPPTFVEACICAQQRYINQNCAHQATCALDLQHKYETHEVQAQLAKTVMFPYFTLVFYVDATNAKIPCHVIGVDFVNLGHTKHTFLAENRIKQGYVYQLQSLLDKHVVFTGVCPRDMYSVLGVYP